MLPAFQTYCLQQSASVNMLNSLEKEKELLRCASCSALSLIVKNSVLPVLTVQHLSKKKSLYPVFYNNNYCVRPP